MMHMVKIKHTLKLARYAGSSSRFGPSSVPAEYPCSFWIPAMTPGAPVNRMSGMSNLSVSSVAAHDCK